MKVYIIRHGESENNRKKYWSGWYDTVLTEKGEADALGARAVLENKRMDKVYASDLNRAISTAKIAIPGCEPQTTSLLREINVGSLQNTPIDTIPKEERLVRFADGYTEYGGETRAQLRKRILTFRKMLEELECERVAIFSHAGWLCGFLNEVLGAKISRADICCSNCAVGVFEFADGKWRLHSWINAD